MANAHPVKELDSRSAIVSFFTSLPLGGIYQQADRFPEQSATHQKQ